MFTSLKLHGWRQFRRVEIDFHPRLTVLTGANGAGKTTLMSLVSRHFGWSSRYISTPKSRNNSASLSYSADYWDFDDETSELTPTDVRVVGPQHLIGEISYANGGTTALSVPTSDTGTAYEVHLPNQQHVEGLHIPSHRSTYSFQQITSIPVVPRRRSEAYQHYVNLVRQRFNGGHGQSPQYYMKETLIALAAFGYGNQALESDVESATIFEEFQEVLRKMLPPKLGFRRLVVRVPEVVLDTATGSFSIDAVSGGVAAVIDLAWQVFMYQPSGSAFVVTLDEPENHLHPELQRRLLADLLSAFPLVQFVVATHSPFIVGSVPDSNVYVLGYDDTSRVNSVLLDTINKAGSANEILRDVLGLEFTLPVWVETRIDDLMERYANRDFTTETLADLRREMGVLGLERHAAQAIAKLAERVREKNDPA